ncbi:MAG: RNA polymerase sigma factor RpoD/SigA [Candidatus Obscuribacterales bacterium]|nr:RNA polymerase sigma factor RpoD/SigA [Candidatus Obscuribacterales bacterium]
MIAKSVRKGAACGYLDFVGGIKLLSAEEERAIAMRARRGDGQARNQLILANLKLVLTIARRYKNRGLPLIDLLQEGNIGLMIAVNKFKPARGNRFSTYASWWIRQSMTRALSNQSRTIRLPVHLNEFMTKLRRLRSQLSIELGRTPTSAEISEKMDERVEKVDHVLEAFQPCDSLDREVFSDQGDGSVLSDVIADSQSSQPDSIADRQFIRKQVNQILENLNEKERKVIALRFGMDSGKERTLKEVSDELGLTRDQVGKVSCLAMCKLRKAARKEDFEDILA